MRQDSQHIPVLNVRPWLRPKRIGVWSDFWEVDSLTFKRAKKKLKNSSVEGVREVSRVILWGYGPADKIEIAPRDEEG